MTIFQEAVLSVVRIVPAGHVMSYGQVAAYLGYPRAARQVGWALHAMEGAPDFPWWRIVNNTGLITIKGGIENSKVLQADMLRSEGVLVDDQLRLDITRHRFRPSKDLLTALKLDAGYIESVLEKYN